MTTPARLLFSLDDIKIFKDLEIFTETYLVALTCSLNLPGGIHCQVADRAQTDRVHAGGALNAVSPGNELVNWFQPFISPIFSIRRSRRHTFPGGLPLYYGSPGDVTTVYVAVMESDKGADDARSVLESAMAALPNGDSYQALADLAKAGASPRVALVKQAFGLLIKVVEQALINNRDDIQYTNVFTFKGTNGYLEGTHQFGNHKVNMTMSVELVGSSTQQAQTPARAPAPGV